jgi:hypothetical protein
VHPASIASILAMRVAGDEVLLGLRTVIIRIENCEGNLGLWKLVGWEGWWDLIWGFY